MSNPDHAPANPVPELVTWWPRNPYRLDMPLLLVAILVLGVSQIGNPTTNPWWITVPLWCAQTFPLAIRRTHPTWALGIAAAAMLVQVLVGELLLSSNLLLLPYIYSTAKHATHKYIRGGTLGLCAVAVGLFTWHSHSAFGQQTTAQNIATMASVVLGFFWFLGFQAHRKIQALHTLAATNAIQQRTIGQKIALAQNQERLHIAGDLHHIVTHSLAELHQQTAPHRKPWSASSSQYDFDQIATTARDALNDARQLVSTLRRDSPGDAPPRNPSSAA